MNATASAPALADTLQMIDKAGEDALAASGPEDALHCLVAAYHAHLGDRRAHERPGALREGERQYFVAGAFIVTPDRRYHMLVGNVGFPPEQRRLMVPIDAGHPGWVYERRQPLVLENTDEHGEFRQYLKTSRMGSSIYAPMIFRGSFLGQVVMAAQARNTMRESDLRALIAVSRLATALWLAHEGPAWLEGAYPPPEAAVVGRDGY